jgi:hypothetical protein
MVVRKGPLAMSRVIDSASKTLVLELNQKKIKEKMDEIVLPVFKRGFYEYVDLMSSRIGHSHLYEFGHIGDPGYRLFRSWYKDGNFIVYLKTARLNTPRTPWQIDHQILPRKWKSRAFAVELGRITSSVPKDKGRRTKAFAPGPPGTPHYFNTRVTVDWSTKPGFHMLQRDLREYSRTLGGRIVRGRTKVMLNGVILNARRAAREGYYRSW